jgi:hypothetical protein
MAGVDNYGDLQQPAGGYGSAGGANASTGYSDVQNPPSPYQSQPAPVPAATPTPSADPIIKAVKIDLGSLGVSLPQGADLYDMQNHKNFQDFDKIQLGAWTESSQEVYVNLPLLQAAQQDPKYGPKNVRALALMAVRHEIEHLIQFKKSGPPKTFHEMISFEAKAYPITVTFIDDKNTMAFFAKIGADQQVVQEQRKEFASSATKFVARAKVSATDAQNRAWLVDKSNAFLPPTLNGNSNYKCTDLY